MTLPILYSLRHCPFAMRARLAIFRAEIAINLRDVKLTNKPDAMLQASPKGTVPILVVNPSLIIDESLEIMLWSLAQHDPHNMLRHDAKLQVNNEVNTPDDYDGTLATAQRCELLDALALIETYDTEFKPCLERYKCAKRYHETNTDECRLACEVFVQDLESRLQQHDFLLGKHESLADLAILPFIRQFAKVERAWYVQSSYVSLKRWLNRYLQSAAFNKIMAPYDMWAAGKEDIVFCAQ